MTADLAMLLRTVEAQNARLARIERKLDEGTDRLRPLYTILDCKPNTARMRIRRDPELAKMGVKVGKSLLFTKSAVLDYYRARDKQIGGGDE